MNRKEKKINILHVTHCWGGGITAYLDDIKKIFSRIYNISILRCNNGKIELELNSKDGKKNIKYFNLPNHISMNEISNPGYRKIISLILKAFEIDVIHINITLGHTYDIFDIANKLGIPIVYTVHDFYYICPTFHLINKDGSHCEICSFGQENDSCLKNHPYISDPDFDKSKLYRWRAQFSKIKDLIDIYIFPSISCKEIFCSFYPIEKEKIRIIHHGCSFRKTNRRKDFFNDKLRVAILGSMFKHKGETLFKYILENNKDQRIKFHHFGDGFLRHKHLECHGAYDRSRIKKILMENKIDIVLLLSTWPETFSYTLSEAIVAGIPSIVTNLGSLKERVNDGRIGWVVNYKEPESILQILNTIIDNPNDLAIRRTRVSAYNLKTIYEMRKDYQDIYNLLLSQRKKKESLDSKQFVHKLEKVMDNFEGNKVQPLNDSTAIELFQNSMEYNR